MHKEKPHSTQLHWSRAMRAALAWPIAKRSLVIMAVVGSILNIINQGDALISNGALNWWKIVLTYCVPFCVATYGAFWAFMNIDQDRRNSS